MNRQTVRRLLLPLFATCLTAGSAPAFAGLSAAAAMRIDVEVYKGPLSKELYVQAFELYAKVEDAKRSFSVLHRNIDISMGVLGCKDDLKWHSEDNIPEEDDDPKYKSCILLQEIFVDAHHAVEKANELLTATGHGNLSQFSSSAANTGCCAKGFVNQPRTPWQQDVGDEGSNRKEVENIQRKFEFLMINNTARYGEWLRARASFWATNHAAIWPKSKRVRIDMANFTQFAADYGNQIGSRADALAKQMLGVGGFDVLRDQLASSTYLRDSTNTHYLNLYDWNDAGVTRDALSHTDRVRMVEQLVNDTHWAKINSVFAAAQGEAGLVLVKDDIGNWNLKSYDNDPSELLAAYREVGYAALATAAKLASDATSAGKAADMLGFANRVALGADPSASQTRARVSDLRSELISNLKGIRAHYESETVKLIANLDQARTKAGAVVEPNQDTVDNRTRELDVLETERDTLRDQLQACPQARPSENGNSGSASVTSCSEWQRTWGQLKELEDVSIPNAEKELSKAQAELAKAKQDAEATRSLPVKIEGQLVQLEASTNQRLESALDEYRRTIELLGKWASTANGGTNANSQVKGE